MFITEENQIRLFFRDYFARLPRRMEGLDLLTTDLIEVLSKKVTSLWRLFSRCCIELNLKEQCNEA